MNRNTLNNLSGGGQRRKGQGPTTYKPPRNDPSLLNPPAPPPKPWNYSTVGGGGGGKGTQLPAVPSHKAQAGPPAAATVSDKSKAPPACPPGPKLTQPLSKTQLQSKPAWDPFFWKNEAQLKSGKRPNLGMDDGFGDIFANYPKFLDLIRPEIPSADISSPASEKKGSTALLPPVDPSPPIVSPTTPEKSGDTGKPPRTNYHKWWETVLGELPTTPKVTKKETSGGGDNSSSSKVNQKPFPVVATPCTTIPIIPVRSEAPPVQHPGEKKLEYDTFVLELADVSELVEFLLYKCAAEECLPMLPEVLQDLDIHFRSLVAKYLDSKKEDVRDDSTNHVTAAATGSDGVDLGVLTEISTLHKELQSKNAAITKTNECLLAEVGNLKSQLQVFQDLTRKQEAVEGQLRAEIRELKKWNAVVDGDDVGNPGSTSPPPPITFDLIQLKVENETLKLMNTKLRHETELNNRLLGVMELNYLCQSYQRQEGSSVEVGPGGIAGQVSLEQDFRSPGSDVAANGILTSNAEILQLHSTELLSHTIHLTSGFY